MTLTGVDRPELADFLRRRRAGIHPEDIGLPKGARRRTPGLRREEVAHLAGMSVDYYTRLEQARGPRPSRQVLAALARALRLTGDERDHLYHLVGEPAPRSASSSETVRPALLHLLDRLDDTPAQVLDHRGDILAWNDMAAALFGDLSVHPPAERNVAWLFFANPDSRARFLPEDHELLGRQHAAHLRALSADRPDDRRLAELVTRLKAASPEFAELWSEHEVAVRRATTKRVLHPVVGLIELACEILVSNEHDQRLIVHTAPPGSEAHEQLQLLRVVGLQDLSGDARITASREAGENVTGQG